MILSSIFPSSHTRNSALMFKVDGVFIHFTKYDYAAFSKCNTSVPITNNQSTSSTTCASGRASPAAVFD